MKIAVLKETWEGETRVALVPETVKRLVGAEHHVVVQVGSGGEAGFLDPAYEEVGASLANDVSQALRDASLIPVVRPPGTEVVQQLGEGQAIIGLLNPLGDPEGLKAFADQGVTAFAMELIPRIARAQRLDALSSQSSLAGYKATLLAADSLPKFLPMMMTAAGTIPPGRVLVLGAGVAGLQAIATARRLGAQVEAFDVRAATREQVQSLGATFVEVSEISDAEASGGYAGELTEEQQQRQREVIAEHARNADVVITTALIPGRPAPLLLTADAVEGMRTGSVVVDLAAENGGNCELTTPGETVTKHGVIIHAPFNVPAMMPYHASQLYSRNLAGLIELIAEGAELNLDFSDEVVRKSCVTHGGRVVLGEQDSLLPAGAAAD